MGGYEIDALVAVGGMGMVYEATAEDGTRVALKIVKDDLAEDETARRRFRLEAEIAWTVRNPHLVPILDAGEHAGLPFMAERFIDGSSLETDAAARGAPGSQDGVWDLRRRRRRARGSVGRWDGSPGREARQHPARPRRHRVPHRLRAGQGHPRTACSPSPARLSARSPTWPRSRSGVNRSPGPRHLLAWLRRCSSACRGGHRSPTVQGMRLLWAHLQDEPPDPTAGNAATFPPKFVQALKAALPRIQSSDRPAAPSRTSAALSQPRRSSARLAQGRPLTATAAREPDPTCSTAPTESRFRIAPGSSRG